MNELMNLLNIGKSLANKLIKAGIESSEVLKTLGSKEAFIRLRIQNPDACYNSLCALEGAIRGIRWHNLPDITKIDLKNFFDKLK